MEYLGRTDSRWLEIQNGKQKQKRKENEPADNFVLLFPLGTKSKGGL